MEPRLVPIADHALLVEFGSVIDDAVTDTALLGAAVRGEIRVPAGSGMQVPWTALTANGAGFGFDRSWWLDQGRPNAEFWHYNFIG